MDQKRIERAGALIQKLAADFIERGIAEPGILITATRVEISPALKEVVVFVSVWPENKSAEIMGNLEKSRKGFYEYMKENFKIKYMPVFEFELDGGEKARQRIEEILKKNK